jgi:hypothetical protein
MVRRLIAAALVATGLAACGSSSTASTASTAGTAGTAGTASTNGSQGTKPFSAIATAHAQAHTGAQGGSATDRRNSPPRPPEVPKDRMPHNTSGLTRSVSFTIKASMEIRSASRVSPPVIALPNHTHLALSVTDGDHRGHSVAVDGVRARVPAGGVAHLDIRHLTTDTYPVTVDGHAAGKITVGSAGGP